MVVDVKPKIVENYSESNVKRLITRFNNAKAIKDMWLSTFEECYEFALPQRESFYSESIGRRRSDRIFDETAVVGVQEFASRLQSGIVPNYARWADFVAGTEIPKDEQKDVNLELDQVSLPPKLLESYKENVSKAGVVVGKNFDKFLFNGKTLPKNRLVLELVRHVAALDDVETLADLKEVFPDNFWSKGKETTRNRNAFIVELEAVAAEKNARFFGKDDDKIQLRSGEVAVVNSQWGDDNLRYLLDNISYIFLEFFLYVYI